MRDNQLESARQSLPPLRGLDLVIACIMTGMANLIVALDFTVANVAIPSIAAGLGASPKEGAWVITSYAVAEAITVPLTGWLARRFGPAHVFVASVAAFGLASALCGLSNSLAALVTFRILQGFAGGPMIALSQTLLLSIFPKEKAAFATTIWAMTAVVGPSFGPVLGGYICDNFSWHWIFLINVPLAVMGFLSCWRLLIPRDTPGIHQSVDFVGLALTVAWVGTLQVALDRGHEVDWLESRFIAGLLAASAVSFVAFLVWELTDYHPIINLRVYRHRGFATTATLLCVAMAAFPAQMLLFTLWVQLNLGYTPGLAGLSMAPSALAMLAGSPIAAWLCGKTDLRLLVSAGLASFALLLIWQTGFNRETTFAMVLATQIGMGSCIAFFFAPGMTLCMSFVEPAEVASATGLFHFMRALGMAIAISASTTMWQDGAARHRISLVDRFNGTEGLDQFMTTGLPQDQAIRYLDQMVQREAVMLSTVEAFSIFAIIMALGAVAIWLVPRARSTGVAAAH